VAGSLSSLTVNIEVSLPMQNVWCILFSQEGDINTMPEDLCKSKCLSSATCLPAHLKPRRDLPTSPCNSLIQPCSPFYAYCTSMFLTSLSMLHLNLSKLDALFVFQDNVIHFYVLLFLKILALFVSFIEVLFTLLHGSLEIFSQCC
jgi:hypothetical protein